jgi:hypothetical protein
LLWPIVGIVPNAREPPAEPDRGVAALDPRQRAVFTAFARPQEPADTVICDDDRGLACLGGHQAGNAVNPSLARRVLTCDQVSMYLLPGRDAVCLLCLLGDEESISGTTSTELAARGGHGFIRRGRPPEGRVTFLGVLPAGAHSPTITRRTGEAEFLALTADDAYWLTTTHDVIAFHWTRADGTVQHAPISTPTA